MPEPLMASYFFSRAAARLDYFSTSLFSRKSMKFLIDQLNEFPINWFIDLIGFKFPLIQNFLILKKP